MRTFSFRQSEGLIHKNTKSLKAFSSSCLPLVCSHHFVGVLLFLAFTSVCRVTDVRACYCRTKTACGNILKTGSQASFPQCFLSNLGFDVPRMLYFRQNQLNKIGNDEPDCVITLTGDLKKNPQDC